MMLFSNIFLILPVVFAALYQSWLYFFLALGLMVFSPFECLWWIASSTLNVWMVTVRPRTAPTFARASDNDHNPVAVMDSVWRFTTQRKTLIDNGQATTRDFTPAYLVIDSLDDVVATLRRTCRRSLQLLSAIADRGHLANVYLAAVTDLPAQDAPANPWTDLNATRLATDPRRRVEQR